MFFSLSKVFSGFLATLIILTFLLTYLMPPLLFDLKGTCDLKRFVPGLLSYWVCIPLYAIVLQVYSYANLHDVSWGNRDQSGDLNLQ